MNDQEPEDPIFQFMKQEAQYLADNGFSEQVMRNLPQTRGFRLRVLSFSWLVAVTIGAAIWWKFGSLNTLSFISFSPAVILSVAFLAFWSMFGLLVYVMATERMIEIE